MVKKVIGQSAKIVFRGEQKDIRNIKSTLKNMDSFTAQMAGGRKYSGSNLISISKNDLNWCPKYMDYNSTNVLMPCVHEATLSISMCSLSREKCIFETMEKHCCEDFGSILTVADSNIWQKGTNGTNR